MATHSYAQLQQEIAKLQAEAEQIRATEVAGVVDRIKEAIAHYELTPQDLFGKITAAPTARKNTGRSKDSGVKFSNGQGGEWGGRGPRPLWLRDAIAAGHLLEEFAVGAATPPAEASPEPSSPAKKSSKPSRASYKDPATGKTWSGFGRQPDWLKKALAAGQTPESMQA